MCCRYRGNVGTIVRSAVQANRFEKIVIVDPAEGGEVVPGEKLVKGRIAPIDIDYYSLQNAPLIEIVRAGSAQEWLAGADPDRKIVAAALKEDAVSAYSKEGREAWTSDCYVLVGAETEGLPDAITEHPNVCNMEIPSLSASINVGCAFSVLLTCMILAQAGTSDV
jgi:tRNA(Leu) C34 or U34 (ribose-2'-O)-methylase TrmL